MLLILIFKAKLRVELTEHIKRVIEKYSKNGIAIHLVLFFSSDFGN
jgi:predicted SpoU family rRNA methylase